MGIAASVAIVSAGLYFYLRPGLSAPAMLACLPPGDGPVLYADVGLLRKTGMLEQIAGKPGGEEADYRKFVDATGFDYRHDLDAALVEWRNGTALFVLKGHFEQQRLADYARANGGLCAKEFCSLPGSVPQRRISFQPLGRSVMALAAGVDSMGAANIREHASQPPFTPPSTPLWLYVPASSFHATADLPLVASTFLEALDGAQSAMLTVDVSTSGFVLALDAPCASPEKAEAIAGRMSMATGLVKSLMDRPGQKPEASSLAAALAGGTFRVEKNSVRGTWPLGKGFFEGLGK